MVVKLLHANIAHAALSMTLANFGGQMVGIFIPLLLLTKGVKLWQICLYYLCASLCKLLLNYPSTKFIATAGVRRSMIVGYILNGVQLFILAAFIAHRGDWLMYIVPITMAITNCLLWNAMHFHVSSSVDESQKGRNLAALDSLRNFCEIAAPAAGALVASLFGGSWLVVCGGLLALSAVVPMLLSPSDKKEVATAPLTLSFHNAPPRDLIASFGFNLQKGIGWLVWPIYLAIFLPNFRSIGIITALSSAAAILLLYIAAKRNDRGRNRRVLVESTALISIAHISRIFAFTPLTLALASAFYRMSVGYLVLPWTSAYYAHARRKGIAYIMSMELAGDLAYIVMWSGLGVIAFFAETSFFFSVVFGAAAITAWLTLLIRHEKRKPEPALSLQSSSS